MSSIIFVRWVRMVWFLAILLPRILWGDKNKDRSDVLNQMGLKKAFAYYRECLKKQRLPFKPKPTSHLKIVYYSKHAFAYIIPYPLMPSFNHHKYYNQIKRGLEGFIN